MPRVFGMVTTKNSGDYTREALKTFFACTPLAADDRFLLIDNDEALDLTIVPRSPNLFVVKNPQPLSFAANGNQLLLYAEKSGATAFYLNNDVIFTPNWLDPLVPDMPGIVTPTSNQNYTYRGAGLELKPVMELSEYLGHESELLALVAQHRKAHSQFSTAYKTPFFCVKIPPLIYGKVGLLDTRFNPAGGEDDDYCIRVYLKGFSVFVAEASYLLHFGGRSTWSGAETREEWQKREARFIGAFAAKWGKPLARFLLMKDASVLAGEGLREIEAQGGVRALMMALAERGGIALPSELL